jgi:hypothetical protein
LPKEKKISQEDMQVLPRDKNLVKKKSFYQEIKV